MSDDTFRAALNRIRRHCIRSGQRGLSLAFHGGEPTLAGPQRFDAWCQMAKDQLGGLVELKLAMQTNGTLLDTRWTGVLRKHKVTVGISIDGPKDVHDAARPDLRGAGSYDAAARGLALLKSEGIRFGVLAVIQLGADGLQIHRHLGEMGVNYIDYLLPGFTHDTIAPIHARYGMSPCADFLLPIIDHWMTCDGPQVRVRVLWEMASMILGGKSSIDAFGNKPFRFIFIEADGAIEGLDILRVSKNGAAGTGLNVMDNDFAEIAAVSPFHRAAIFDGLPLPTDCHGCPEAKTCGGGYLPTRYSEALGFDRPTVWCRDLLLLFGRLREWLEVPPEETHLRRRAIADMRAERSPLALANI